MKKLLVLLTAVLGLTGITLAADITATAAWTVVNPVYTAGTAITANSSTITGGPMTAGSGCSANPALPAGLVLTTSSTTACIISGTPTASAATRGYRITTTPASGATFQTAITLTVGPAILRYRQKPAVYTVGTAITSNTPVAVGTLTTYSISPDLAAATGLSFSTSTGVISGTPSIVSDTATYTITANGAAGGSTTTTVQISTLAAVNYSAWTYHKSLSINTTSTGANVANDVFNMPLLVRLNALNFNFSQANADGSDIRFTESDNSSNLSYEIETWDPVGKTAAIWVLVNRVVGNSSAQSIRMHWGKNDAVSESNGTRVFTKANGYLAVYHFGSATQSTTDPRPNVVTPGTNNALPVSLLANPTKTGMIGLADSTASGTSAAPAAGHFFLGTLGAGTFPVGSELTMSMWIKPFASSATGFRQMMTLGSTSASNIGWNSVYFGRNASTNTYVGQTTMGLQNNGSFTGTGYVAGVWQHVAMTVSGTRDSIYKDGALIASTQTAGQLRDSIRSANYIGRANWTTGTPGSAQTGGDSGVGGVFDEARISTIARSADFTKLEYQTQFATSAVVSLPLDSVTYPTTPFVWYTAGSISPTVYGGSAITYSVSPALPTGLSLNTSTGVISGTPVAANLTGTVHTITAGNPLGSVTRQVTIIVNPAPPTGLVYGAETVTYTAGVSIGGNAPLLASGGPITDWSVAPSLPAGLSINATTGGITGTPTSATPSALYTVTGSTVAGNVTKALNITIVAAEDYTSGWSTMKTLVLNTAADAAGVGSSLSSFPVLVRLTSAHASVFSTAKTDGSDIRFALLDGTQLPYDIERWDMAGQKAEIWVSLPTVSASAATSIRMYYGNGSATSLSSSNAVFAPTNGYVGVWHLGNAANITTRPNAISGGPAATPANDVGAFGGGSGTYVIPDGAIGKADSVRGGGNRNTPVAGSDYLNIGNAAGAGTTPFTGANSYQGYSDFSTGFSYSLWVKPNVTAANTYMLELANLADGNNNIQVFRPTGAATSTVAYEHHNNTSSGGAKTSSSVLTNGAWQQIYITVGTGSTPTVNMYRNGGSIFTAATMSNATRFVTRTNAWIGKSNYGGDGYFGGVIDDPQISKVARSADWTKLSYKNQKPGTTPVFDLSYTTPTMVLSNTGVAITPNNATVAGTATRYRVTPALPLGLLLNTTTGVISGAPTLPSAAANYVVTAYGDSSWSTTTTVNITVNLAAPTGLSYSPSAISYEAGLPAGGLAPQIGGGAASLWSVTPTLPAGLSINASTGVISGVPTTPTAAADYTVKAENAVDFVTTTVNIAVTGSEDYTTGWDSLKTFNLNTTAAAAGVTTGQGSVPVLVRLTSAHPTIFATANADGSDIRFSRPNGTRLAYQIERWNKVDQVAEIWVAVDSVLGNGMTPVRIHWGNAMATSKSNGGNVFNRAAGFEGTWHLSELAADSARDATLNGFTGASNGAILDTVGTIGRAKFFNNSTSIFYRMPGTEAPLNRLNFPQNGNYSVSAWVRQTTAASRTMISKSENQYALEARNSGTQWEFHEHRYEGDDLSSAPTASTVLGAWAHVVGVRNGTTQSIYVNGALATSGFATDSSAARVVPRITDTALHIGKNPAATGNRPFLGMIDEVQISSTARSADWIKLNYMTQKAASSPLADLKYSAPSYSFLEETQIDTIQPPTLAGTATRFSISPSLPPTLNFNTATGRITGTAEDGSPSTTYTVTAYGDSSWTATTTFNLAIVSAPPMGINYAQDSIITFVGDVWGSNAPTYTGTILTWTVTPSLPTGMSLASNGTIVGIPTAAAPRMEYVVKGEGPDGNDTETVVITVAPAAEDLTTWSGHRSITINTSATGANITGTVLKYPLLVRLSGGESNIFEQALAAGADIRFTKPNNVTRIPHETVVWDAVGKKAEIWVQVDSVFGNNASQTIRMHWGKAGVPDSSSSGQVFNLTNGFVSVWHMGNAPDSSARPNAVTGAPPATPVFFGGNPTYTAPVGMIGYADTLRGSVGAANGNTNHDYIHVLNGTNHPGFTGYNAFPNGYTLTAWVRPQDTRNFSHFVDMNSDNTVNGYNTIYYGRNGTTSQVAYRNRTGTGSNGGNATASGSTDIVNGAWQYFSVSKPNATVAASVYNGRTAAGVSLVGSHVTIPSDSSRKWVYMGKSFDATNAGFAGSLDEVRIANTTRSADWVALDFETQKAIQFVTDIGLAPPTLAYTPDSATYLQGAAISTLTPAVSGLSVTYTGSLPAGLNLNASTGAITGTPAAPSAKTKYTITATNLGGSVTDSIFIRVNPAAPTGMAYASNNLTLMVGTAMAPDSVTITNLVDSFTVAPALPAGLSLDIATGVISGTPLAITASMDYIITATNVTGTAQSTVTILVNPAIPVISYATPKVYTLGVVIDTLAPVSSAGPVASYAISPDLNAATGLTFNTVTGKVTGTATSLSAAADYTIIATNVSGTDTAIVNITVNDVVPVIAYTSPHTYTVGTVIDTLSPVSTGGVILGYSITPNLNTATGLAFNTTTGKITGTPTTASAAADYTIIATNSGGTDTAMVNITAIYAKPEIAYATPKVYTVGISIDTLKPTSSGGPLTSFTITPNLTTQTGLAFNATTGFISGTPSLTQVATDYTIIVNGPGGLDTAVVNILTSNEVPPSIVYADTAVYLRGVAIAAFMVDTTGSGPIDSITVAPALPAGLTLNKITGTVTGTPTVVAVGGNYTFTAHGLGGVDNEVVNLTVIDSVPVISYVTPQTYAVGTLITPLSPSVSQGAVVSYAISPNLTTNTGLAFSTSTGVISGTPTIAQTVATYTIIATNSGGTDTAAVNITVQGAPLLTTAPHDTSVVSGAAASFTVAASAAGTLSYQWKKAGVDIGGAISATYPIASATLADTGVYTVVVTSTLNATTTSTTSIAAHLYVNVAPVIATAPHDSAVVSGSPASFTVAAAAGAGSSAGTYSYQWKKNGTNVVSGGTSATYSIASAAIADTGSYTVVVTRTLNGSVTSTTTTAAKLLVNVAPVIATTPHDTTVVSGAASFTVVATGEGMLSYQWKKNGANVVSGGTSATYSIASAAIADTGSYTVVVTSTLSGTTTTTTTTAVKLFVNVAPVIATAPHDSTIVSGAGVSFTVAAGTGLGSSAGTLSYQWRKGLTNVSTGTGGTTATYSISGATLSDTTGLLNVVITRTLNGTTTTTTSGNVALRVNVAPTITTQVRDTTVVAGGPVSFTVGASVSGGGVLSYQWKKNGTNVSAGTGGTTATYALAAAAITDTATYTVTVTSTLNGNAASVTTATGGVLKVNVAPTIATAPHDTTVIAGAASSFSVVAGTGPGSSAGTLSYQWRKATTNVSVGTGGTTAAYAIGASAITDTSGLYSVVITRTLNGTTTSVTSGNVALRVNAVPVIATAPRDTTVISGANASFTVAATVAGGGVLSYQWKKDGANVASAGTSASYALTGATLVDTAAYTVTVTSTLNGTSTSVTTTAVNLRVNVTPSLTTAPHDSTVVAATPVSFTVVAAAGPGSSAGVLSYQWRKNGTNVASGGTAATLAIASAAITDTGSYTVVVTRTLNATTTTFTSSAGVLRINAAPVIATQPRDTTVLAGVAGTFSVSASAVGGGVLSYQWRKDGANITGATAVTYSTAGAALVDTGAYSVVVTSTLSGTVTTTTSSAGNLRVNVAPTIATQPEATQTIVVGGNVTKTVVAAAGAGSSAGTLTYQWRKNGANLVNGAVVGGGTVSGATTASLTISTLTAADSGTYTVVITRTLSGTVSTATSVNSLLAAPTAIMPDAFVIRVSGQERPYAFQLPAGTTTEKLTLSIMDVWGRTVWSQTAYPVKDKMTEISWNGRSANGRQASAGMYVVRIAVLNAGKTTTYVRKSVTLKPR